MDLKKLKIWEKPRRAQGFMILTEDGRIVDEQLMVLKGCAENESTMEAWPVEFSNQVKDPELGFMQVVSERDVNPIPLWHENSKEWSDDTITKIAEAETDSELQDIERKAAENKQFWIVLCIVVTLCIAILLAVVSNFYLQGSLKFPWQSSSPAADVVKPGQVKP